MSQKKKTRSDEEWLELIQEYRVSGLPDRIRLYGQAHCPVLENSAPDGKHFSNTLQENISHSAFYDSMLTLVR